MKTFALLAIGLVSSVYAVVDNTDYVGAIRNGAEAKYVYRITQEDGAPIEGANVHVWFKSYGRPQDNADWSLVSDTNGVVVVSHRVNESFGISVEKEGFYGAWDKIDYLSSIPPKVSDGKWQPYGELRSLKLKRIDRLGTLRVLPKDKRMGEWRIPVRNEWIAFDLEKCDWIEPYGIGRDPDMLIRINSVVTHPITDCAFRMDVCFTNNLYAGGYIKQKDTQSDLKWSAVADTNEVYKSEFTYLREVRGGEMKDQAFLPQDSYLVFRTRSKTDEEGNLKSIHYGVICGEWASGSETMNYDESVFNPIENDPCIEDSLFLRERNRDHRRKK